MTIKQYLGCLVSIEALRTYLRQHLKNTEALQTVGALLDTVERQNTFQRLITEELPDLLIVVDRRGRIVQFNHACEVYSGYKAEEILYRPAWETLIAPEMRAQVETAFVDLQPHLVPLEADIMWLTKSGEIRTARWTSSMLFDDDGKVAFVLTLGRDVTEARRQSTEPELSEEQLRFLFQESPIGLYVTEMYAHHKTIFNPAFCHILGYPLDELRDLTFRNYTFPADVATEQHFIDEIFANRRDLYHLEKRFIRKDGRIIWGHFIGCVVRDSNGAPLYGLGILEDITERKHNEELLRSALQQLEMLLQESAQAEKYYRLIAENATDIIFILNAQRVTVYISPACYQMMGYYPEELLRIDTYTLIHPDDVENVRAVLTTLDQENPSIVTVYRTRRKNGSYLWLETKLRVVMSDNGEVEEIIGIARDISGRKEHDDALAVTHQELEAFTSSVTHDLRAPLRAIEGFARMLLQEQASSLTQDTSRYISLIHDNAQHMNRLINDLLELSRLGRQQIERQPVDMTALALETYAALDLHNRVIDFTVDDLPSTYGDAGLLRVVFDNLLRNAVKFTAKRPTAVIEIGYYTKNGETVYWVKDNGVGFNMQYASKLFGVFQRLHSKEEFEGTGIGLATVQRVIQRHGGRVWAQSEPEKGATFYFTLREE